MEGFKEKVATAVARLAWYLEKNSEQTPPPSATSEAVVVETEPIPRPPALYTEPPYIGSHKFVGRQAQLDTLSDWALAADSHPVLLFEAIGGAGKSMLTWEWINNHSTNLRADWAGRFWYSFYERGAIMADFCARALAYITGQSLDDFGKQKTPVLTEKLLHHLRAKPYLFVLDGLERVLVSYHRIDAAQLVDEDAGTTDEIAHRDPCAAIRPEDDDLLRALAGTAPSKILITSRLVPRVLLNSASQPIPGVLRERLPGLRPADAEALLRSCGVEGDSPAIQKYLQTHCDCHPLVTGVVAGLVKNYFRDRGNFDAWATDREAGGALNLAELDLVQKRNHILRAALEATPNKSRQLLSLLALLSEAVDAVTLDALNPFRPPRPDEVATPIPPQDGWLWKYSSYEEKAKARRNYAEAVERRQEYETSLIMWPRSAEYLAAPRQLADAAQDLEYRGLLQYDVITRRYDLHPVVRGVAIGGLQPDETERHGHRLVDHFSRQTHVPYEQAETIEDVRIGLELVRALLRLGRGQAALRAFYGDLANALLINLEANAEVLALIKPVFSAGWSVLPLGVTETEYSYLLNIAALALDGLGETDEALAALGLAIESDLRRTDLVGWGIRLANAGHLQSEQGRLAKSERYFSWALDIATQKKDQSTLFGARLDLFWQYAIRGMGDEAERLWQVLGQMRRPLDRGIYNPGDAERMYAHFRFWRGELREEELARAEQPAQSHRNRKSMRALHRLRGEWHLEHDRWAKAAESLRIAITLAHEMGQTDAAAETMLALTQFHLKHLTDSQNEAERLARATRPHHRGLAALWLLIGDEEKAKLHAFVSYREAWAEGEPYVYRYELDKSRTLFARLGLEIPDLLPYDPAKDEPLPWEAEVSAAIKHLRAGREAEKAEIAAENNASNESAKNSTRTKRSSRPRAKR